MCTTEEDFLRSQASMLEQVHNLQPYLDSSHIKGERTASEESK